MEGPPIRAVFHAARDSILSITLSPNPAGMCEWEVLGGVSSLEVQVSRWMEAYLAKTDPRECLPLIFGRLSPFTTDILAALQHIPFGHTITYQRLAEQVGRSKAARAAGSACGRNSFPLVVPCHRVVASGDGLGGFSLDIAIKKALLSFEQ